ncbi:MAG: hypothetical protein INR65_17220 [Gluconacetobacter diazotrophicus]|nr:hypothetical protein [Gluconacetobacter diazotrophicus]
MTSVFVRPSRTELRREGAWAKAPWSAPVRQVPIAAIVLAGALYGPPGLVVGAPLAEAGLLLVRMSQIGDVLRDRTVKLERPSGPA